MISKDGIVHWHLEIWIREPLFTLFFKSVDQITDYCDTHFKVCERRKFSLEKAMMLLIKFWKIAEQ
jgi:hypothetical protein